MFDEVQNRPPYFVDNKAKGQISKWVFQENKARQIFRKTNIYVCVSGQVFIQAVLLMSAFVQRLSFRVL